MSDCQEFPNTWEEFEQWYGFEDKKEIYTNGSRLIQSFRVKQWLDHIAESKRKKGKWQRRKGDDCWECSECHAVLENSDIGNHNFYYCYHCGADMMDICGYMDLEKANYERPYQQTGSN